ncbi:PDDEXK nuclease domain-containing protein [Segatella copri]|uniref:PDDEXK nuclease domain-containing protein n=1 Tax=Segatella copri TaxID=165179 RepID=A0AAW5UQ05_9BACT|nr:PDDEXK nuclease domain-containing protein [Segatella copri]MCW4111886.1 PDDEXK nuclease domain-containing protein [Segatella copri]MCW4122075.1 PDDEXK nuclease domain-containing protein [Segatella copri]MCW4155844.1 PDDEXK nuclease domain-containing protein [Segatella copri]
MVKYNVSITQEAQFAEVIDIIQQHKSHASQVVNNEILLTAWYVGKYVSEKLKTEEWGNKVVSQLSEFIRSNHPEIKGFSRSSIYNMVMLYDEYSSKSFKTAVEKYLGSQFVQPLAAQIGDNVSESSYKIMKPTMDKQIVQMPSGQFPNILFLTTLSNHYDILCRCKSFEERLFYILYAHKERLSHKELQRAITTQTYETLLSDKNNMSKGLLETYPNSPIMFKDTYFVDFLNLPKKHSEKRLKNGLLEHMKQFILELGKDFIFMDQEYPLTVGASTYKADLLFFHRGLQALVAVELKKTKFHPRDLGQLEFYLEALDRDVKRSNENPSIGIILCPDVDKVVVEYAMSRSMSPTMVAEYKRILIPQEKMQQQLREFCQFFSKEDKS